MCRPGRGWVLRDAGGWLICVAWVLTTALVLAGCAVGSGGRGEALSSRGSCGRAGSASLGAGASTLGETSAKEAASDVAAAAADGAVFDAVLELDAELELLVAPPAGWRLDATRRTGPHVHKTWVSPSGDTAFGVIRFRLPVPVGDEVALWGFLQEMRRAEGEARLLEREPGYVLPGGKRVLRFVAEGGKYRVRSVLLSRGFRGWCVYAGTLRDRPVRGSELDLALRHRDRFRLPDTSRSSGGASGSGSAWRSLGGGGDGGSGGSGEHR